MKIVVQDANGSVHFLPISISCHHFIEQKKNSDVILKIQSISILGAL